MKIFKITFLLIVFVVALAGCTNWGVQGNGKLKTVEKEVPYFDKVEISGVFYVKVKVGNKNSVRIKAESNLIKYIDVDVENNTLEISSSRHLSPRRKLLILITTQKLRAIETSGVNKVLVVNVDSDKLKVDCSGASEIKLKGRAKKLIAEVSGASYLNSASLKADYVDIDVSGASNACVFAGKVLKAEASGASSIKYKGKPDKVEKDVSGVSSIVQK